MFKCNALSDDMIVLTQFRNPDQLRKTVKKIRRRNI